MNESYKEKFRKMVLDDTKLKESFGIDGNLLVAISLVKINHSDVYMYGAGQDSLEFLRFFSIYGINVKAIIDQDKRKIGRNIWGVPIISAANLEKIEKEVSTFVFVCTTYFEGMEQMKITEVLYQAGISGYYAIDEKDRQIMTTNTAAWVDSGRVEYYRSHITEICRFVDMLSDQNSMDVLMEYIRSYIACDVYRLPQIQTGYKYFYGDENKELLYEHLEDEVWVNCGSYIGDTIMAYFSLGIRGKSIYAFEGDKRIVTKLEDNLSLLPEDLKEQVTVINEFITDTTDFERLLHGEKCTFINADIEGNELELLKAMKSVIRQDRPVIAICLYHKKEDIVEIPQYINSLVDDYKFYLRKYTAWINNINRNHELVLYAVPKERSRK